MDVDIKNLKKKSNFLIVSVTVSNILAWKIKKNLVL
jgi:hypothetical protein